MSEKAINLSVFDAFPVIKTHRLTLREILPEDAHAIYEMRSNGMVNRFIARPDMQTLEQSEALVKKTREAYAQKKGIGWAGVLRDAGDIIGTCGFNSLDFENLRAEIGGELSTRYWGREIALEAVEAIVSFGFEELGLHSIEAKVDPQNRGAIRLLEYLGFQKEAHFKDRIHFDGKFTDMAVYGCIRQ